MKKLALALVILIAPAGIAFAAMTPYVDTGGSAPCASQGTCPCSLSPEWYPQEWKECVVANYPKLSDGSTRLCRLQPGYPAGEKATCMADQGGFENVIISPDGTETAIW